MAFILFLINYSSLQSAVLCNNVEIVKLLINNPNININLTDSVLNEIKNYVFFEQ